MQEIIKEAYMGLCKVRDMIESGQLDGAELSLNFFTDEPEIISELISELHSAHKKLEKTSC